MSAVLSIVWLYDKLSPIVHAFFAGGSLLKPKSLRSLILILLLASSLALASCRSKNDKEPTVAPAATKAPAVQVTVAPTTPPTTAPAAKPTAEAPAGETFTSPVPTPTE